MELNTVIGMLRANDLSRCREVWLLHLSDANSDEKEMQRRVQEETGIDARAFSLHDWHTSNIYEIYPVWRHRYAPGVTHNTEHVFGLCVSSTVDVTLAPREHLQYQWMPWTAAADKCFSASNAEAILQLPNRI